MWKLRSIRSHPCLPFAAGKCTLCFLHYLTNSYVFLIVAVTKKGRPSTDYGISLLHPRSMIQKKAHCSQLRLCLSIQQQRQPIPPCRHSHKRDQPLSNPRLYHLHSYPLSTSLYQQSVVEMAMVSSGHLDREPEERRRLQHRLQQRGKLVKEREKLVHVREN